MVSISAAEIERVFSKAGQVIDTRRNRLGARKEDMFIVTAYNMTKEWRKAQKDGGRKSEREVVSATMGLGIEVVLDTDGEEDD